MTFLSYLAPSEYPHDLIAQTFIPPTTDLRSKISSTIAFVRSFILLCSVPHENFQSDKEYIKLKEIVLKSIALLYEYLTSLEGLSLEFEIVKCCIGEIHRLFDSKANFFENELVHLSMMFVENLLIDIYKTTELNMVR